jgi:hypothetical protein
MANDDEPGVLLVLLALAAAVYAVAWTTEPDQEPQLPLGAEMAMPDPLAPTRRDIGSSSTMDPPCSRSEASKADDNRMNTAMALASARAGVPGR